MAMLPSPWPSCPRALTLRSNPVRVGLLLAHFTESGSDWHSRGTYHVHLVQERCALAGPGHSQESVFQGDLLLDPREAFP